MIGLMLLIIMIPVILTITIMPYLTRRTISFGISISEENFNQSIVRQMRKNYAIISGVLGLTFLIAMFICSRLVDEETFAMIMSVALIVPLVYNSIVYLVFYNKMKKLKAEMRWDSAKTQVIALDTSFRNRKLVYSNGWFVIHIAFVLIGAVIVAWNYDKLPDLIPMHYDFQGNVTRTAEKSIGNVFMPNLLQLCMVGIFMLINTIIMRGKQQIDSAKPEQSLEQNITFRRRWSMFILINSFLMVLMFAFMQWGILYGQDQQLIGVVSMLFPAILIIYAIVLSISTGQGGSRIRPSAKDSTTPPVDDDRYWKLGAFYFNPNDPSLFVEKRIGVGWTINIARPAAWLILIGIIAVVAVVPLLASYIK